MNKATVNAPPITYMMTVSGMKYGNIINANLIPIVVYAAIRFPYTNATNPIVPKIIPPTTLAVVIVIRSASPPPPCSRLLG